MFDLAFLKSRLDSATEGSRELDGDVWWIVYLDDEQRNNWAPSWSNVLSVMEREGSPGNGLAQFYDSSKNPPSKLYYAAKFTTSVDDAIRLVAFTRPTSLQTIVETALKNMPEELEAYQIQYRLAFGITRALVDELFVPKE